MKIIITEEQYKTILTENILKDILKDFNIKYEVITTNWMAPSAFMVKKI